MINIYKSNMCCIYHLLEHWCHYFIGKSRVGQKVLSTTVFLSAFSDCFAPDIYIREQKLMREEF